MQTRREFVGTSLGLGAAFRGPKRPNILLIVADDLRPDAIRAVGNRTVDTPNLNGLVRGGVTFTRALCANPLCSPSRAELLTGCTGFRNGSLNGEPIRPELARFAETMRNGGYRTCYSGKWHNDGKPRTRGYDETAGLYVGSGGRWAKPQKDWKGREITGYKGWIFETNDGRPQPELGVGLTADTSRQIADAAVGFIERAHTQPYFLHVNFTAPHDPLIMPPGMDRKYDPSTIPLPRNFLPRHPFDHGNFSGRDEQLLPWPRTAQDVREELAYYYAAISQLDGEIGRMLKTLDRTGQAADTVVIFAADNGLAIGSHGLRGKQNMYEHSVGVPLVFRGPGVRAGRRSQAQVYLRDLFPTACELAGIPIPQTVQGKSVKSLLTGGGSGASFRPEAFGYFRDVQRMIRTDRWKFIWYPKLGREQLFDLRKDPDELSDLVRAPGRQAIRAELRGRLLRWLKQENDTAAA